MAIAYIGIGSNLGDRQANIDRAILLLKEHEDIDVLAVSSMVESDFQGEGPAQDKYLNGVIKVKTVLLPLDLLSQLKMIERRLGRMKSIENAPRPMDLDILFYDDVIIVEGKTINIPHPRLQERLFVLEPLAEIAPELVHPRFGKTVRELKEALLHANCPDSASA